MELGSEKDRNQEGYFDNIGQLDLNQEQAIVLLNSVQESLKFKVDFIEELKKLYGKESVQPEEVTEQINLCLFSIDKLQQMIEPLKELIVFLDEDNNVIKKPTWGTNSGS